MEYIFKRDSAISTWLLHQQTSRFAFLRPIVSHTISIPHWTSYPNFCWLSTGAYLEQINIEPYRLTDVNFPNIPPISFQMLQVKSNVVILSLFATCKFAVQSIQSLVTVQRSFGQYFSNFGILNFFLYSILAKYLVDTENPPKRF